MCIILHRLHASQHQFSFLVHSVSKHFKKQPLFFSLFHFIYNVKYCLEYIRDFRTWCFNKYFIHILYWMWWALSTYNSLNIHTYTVYICFSLAFDHRHWNSILPEKLFRQFRLIVSFKFSFSIFRGWKWKNDRKFIIICIAGEWERIFTTGDKSAHSMIGIMGVRVFLTEWKLKRKKTNSNRISFFFKVTNGMRGKIFHSKYGRRTYVHPRAHALVNLLKCITAMWTRFKSKRIRKKKEMANHFTEKLQQNTIRQNQTHKHKRARIVWTESLH